MKKMLLSLSLLVMAAIVLGGCPAKEEAAPTTPPTEETDAALIKLSDAKIEAGCGMCKYSIEDVNSCSLAVKTDDGKTYMVEGSDISAHDAGLCKTTLPATASGEVKDGKFVASAIELEKPTVDLSVE